MNESTIAVTNSGSFPQETTAGHINGVITKFARANPSLKFGNITQRDATEKLLKKFGYANVLSAVDFVLSDAYILDKYNPIIDSPWKLLQNWMKVVVIAKRMMNGTVGAMKIGGDTIRV